MAWRSPLRREIRRFEVVSRSLPGRMAMSAGLSVKINRHIRFPWICGGSG
jgi:hypothetical protein